MSQAMKRRFVWIGIIFLFILSTFVCYAHNLLIGQSRSLAETLPADISVTQDNNTSTPYPRSSEIRPHETLNPSLTPTCEVENGCGETISVAVLPPQGLYDSCLPEEASCKARLDKMASQGFKIILNDGLRYAPSAMAIQSYADYAAALGMQVILPVKYFPQWDANDAHLVQEFPELAYECGCADNQSFLTYYINTLKNHPALWGYYIADEIHSEYYQGLSFYSEFVKSLDPDHPRLIVEEGTNDPMEIFFTFPSFMSNTTDVLALDNYPYGYIDPYTDLSRFTGESARTLQYWSEKNHLKNAIVLQAFAAPQYYPESHHLCVSWPDCAPFPNSAQMKAQRDQAVLYSKPEMILWFSYPDILRSDDPDKHWMDLVDAAFSPSPEVLPEPTPRIQRCPHGWICEDIGLPKIEGTQSYNHGVWQIQGAGWDIWSQEFVKADQFHYVWKMMDFDGEIQARVAEQADSTPATKSGIMVRKTIDPVSPYYAILVSPEVGILVQYRLDFRRDPVSIPFYTAEPPVYLKIASYEQFFCAYYSMDGEQWMVIPDSTVEIPSFDLQRMAGLVVSSGDEDSLSTTTFDQVSITTVTP